MGDSSRENKLPQIIAIAAGVVAVFAFGVLVYNFVRSAAVEPQLQADIFQLKKIVVDQPNNTALIEHLQQKDLKFRQSYFARQQLNRKAGVLLLISVVVLVSAIKCGAAGKPAVPRQSGDLAYLQQEQANSARRMVSLVAIVLLVLGGAIIFRPVDQVTEEKTQESAFASIEEVGRNWPSFRGPGGDGISAFLNVPVEFDVETGMNILWKSAVPKFGNSSPIVWGNRLFVTGGDDESREVMCYDADSGSLLWSQKVQITGAPATIDVMEDTGYAACTPATDGKRVYAIFATGEIAAFDFEGNKVWGQFLGVPESIYGYASSLAIYQDVVIVQFDQGYEPGSSRLIGIDGASGQVRWQTNREVPNSWTSPVVVRIGESYQVVTVADPFVAGYDPLDGSQIWSVEAVAGDVAPLPLAAGGVVYAIEPDYAIYAIKPIEKGQQGQGEVLWTVEEGAGDITSPVCDSERIYSSSGKKMTCISISGKKVLWEHEFEEDLFASPTIVGDKVYVIDQAGNMIVFKCADTYVQLHQSGLGEDCYATPAFVDGRIYIRGSENVYAIGSDE